ncbi:MAG TPA: tetratricopeptide repeat protein [Steroidobacteraceae bacterium]|nr:tetratricopeptide repeat protein [Steroidobacteraceae bacterium]
MNKPQLKTALVLSATAALTLALYPLHVRAAEKKTPTVSPAFGKPLKAAQEELKSGRYSEALAELDKARALPKPTAWDTHIINELSLYAYAKTKDFPAAAKTMEALVNDGQTDPAEVNRDIRELANIFYQLKDYGKAIDYGNRAIRVGSADATTNLVVAQSYYLKGDYKGTQHFTDNLVNTEIKQGETPKEMQLQLILSSCVKLGDQPCVTHSLERLVTYYPKPEYWENLVGSLFQSRQAAASDVDILNIYRLADDVGAVNKPQQYLEMAQLALEQGSPGDAEHVLEQGYAKNVFTEQRDREKAQRVLALAKKRAASDQASLSKQAADAQAAATGEQDVGVGIAYLGYQQYDKAADALAQGLMKGGVKDQAQARLLLGIAQLKAGKKDQAVKTFHAVSGDPTLVRLANLWTLRARSAVGTVARN